MSRSRVRGKVGDAKQRVSGHSGWVQPRRHLARAFIASAIALVSVGLTSIAETQTSQGGFTATERTDLASGAPVMRRHDEVRGDRRFVGGLSYQRIDMPIDDVWPSLLLAETYRFVLPRADRTELVTEARPCDGSGHPSFLRVLHSYALVEASYVMELECDADAHRIRFHVDRSRHHDVSDAFGYISLSPYPREHGSTIVTWAIAAHLGTNPIVSLSTDRIVDWMLRVPSLLRRRLTPDATGN